MSIQYPGGTIINATFVGATKQDIVSNLETQLTAAGWSVVSGGGTTDVVMQSASTPTAANYIRLRMRSTNLTNCACLNMQNAAATLVSQNYYLLPAAAKTFRVLANKYQFFCTTGNFIAREYVACGVPYTPSFLHGVITAEFGWINGNGISDTDATAGRETFETKLHACGSASWWTGLCNATLTNYTTGGNPVPGGLRLVIPLSSIVASINGYRWHDGTLHLSDPLIAWSLGPVTSDEAKVRGQVWGAMVASDPFSAGTILSSVDGHDWYAVTNNGVGSASEARGTLFVAIT